MGGIGRPCHQISSRKRGIYVRSVPLTFMNRSTQVVRATNPLGTSLASMVIFGSLLLALTEDGGRMLVWDVSCDGEDSHSKPFLTPDFALEPSFSCTIQFDIGFTAAMVLHPATYLNKVLVASSEGDLQLWNIRTQ